MIPLAHGIVGRSDLPIPELLFLWAACVVLVISFVALFVLWEKPRLQGDDARALPDGLGRALTSPVLEVLAGGIGVALLGFTIYAGLAGEQVPTGNFAPTFVYVTFWLGFVPLQVVLGDVFRPFNPWRAIGRSVGWVVGRVMKGGAPEPLVYPPRLGFWPAAIGVLAFGTLELVVASGDEPRTVGVAALAYTVITLSAMALYGTERWTRQGEAFGVYFGLLARMAPLYAEGRRVFRRRLLSGLTGWGAGAGSVALLGVMIGVVSFDGFSAGRIWLDTVDGPIDALVDLGLSATRAQELVYFIGLVLCSLFVAGLFMVAARGARITVGSRESSLAMGRDFVHSLVPIAAAYAAAHYVSLLVFQGQAMGYLVSDPLGRGSDLLGTADWTVDYTVVGAETFWYLQVGFVVAGHVSGLVLAHDRALARFPDPRLAVRSQLWFLAVMVAFTALALWLLSEAKAT